MKIYFDDVENLATSNCSFLSRNGDNSFWLTSPGTRLKQELKKMNIEYYKLSDATEPGLYFVEVNGDPIWWCGLALGENVPKAHILKNLPNSIIEPVKYKKLRIIISADREGGGMIFNNQDGFQATTDAMLELGMPANSVLIIQGNSKIEQQYIDWLVKTKNKKMFDVQYSNHFDKIFVYDINTSPSTPVVYNSLENPNAKDFNSLNRTFKVHRSAHLYYLAISKFLDNGVVSANELRFKSPEALQLMKILTPTTDDILKDRLVEDFDTVLKSHYPRFVDGDWTVNNAANSVNEEIFRNSLVSFVTETKFNEDVIFLTEKVFKCLTYGHPMILLSSCGTLRKLEELGYQVDTCGINPGYNDIEDDAERFFATHRALKTWIEFPRDEKIKKIKSSLPSIEHNFRLSRERNFYHESLTATINNSKDYFK